jgi:hypothetical protein
MTFFCSRFLAGELGFLGFGGVFVFLTDACVVQVEDLEEYLGVRGLTGGGVEERFLEGLGGEGGDGLPEGGWVYGALVGEGCGCGCEGGGLGGIGKRRGGGDGV